MKHLRLMLLAVALYSGAIVFGQPPVASGDSKVPASYVAQPSDRFIFNLNINGWKDAPDSLGVRKIRSHGVDLYLMSDLLFGKKSLFSLGLGIGISAENVHSKSAVVYDSSKTKLIPFAPGTAFDLNKIALTYFDIPVELRVRSKPGTKGNQFKIAAGFKAGFLINSHTKYEDNAGKLKTYDIQHITTTRYGVTGRIGYGNLCLTGYYSLTPLFKEGQGTELTPFSIGIAFLLNPKVPI